MATTAASGAEPQPQIDKSALLAKYRAERDKRRRADGNAQYLPLKGRFAHDPYTPVAQRETKTDHVTFAFIGGGFAGLTTCARMVEAGVQDVRIIEKGGDFGGTWYWNRCTLARNAILRPWSICLSWRKPAIGRQRNMSTRQKFWLIAGASAASSVFTRTRCFIPRLRIWTGTRRTRAG
jgi:NAD(P)-binding Rossmann-like domain